MDTLQEELDIPIEPIDCFSDALEQYDDIKYHRVCFIVAKEASESMFWQKVKEWMLKELEDRHADKLLAFPVSVSDLNGSSSHVTVDFVSVCLVDTSR
jgi:hypothetical protein